MIADKIARFPLRTHYEEFFQLFSIIKKGAPKSNNIFWVYFDTLRFKEVKRILREYVPTKQKLVDIGCGRGKLLQIASLSGVGKSLLVGVDKDLSTLKSCKENTIAEVVVADACHLPFRNHSFDVATCMEVVEHLAQPSMAFRELCRISHYVIITTPSFPIYQRLAKRLIRRLFRSDTHISSLKISEIKILCRKLNVKPLLIKIIPFTIHPVITDYLKLPFIVFNFFFLLDYLLSSIINIFPSIDNILFPLSTLIFVGRRGNGHD
jgi:2-polyprenyl-3-methyl-5-hydroxy-6-metoxy-1,4-benzoquinol methylase